MCFEISDSIFLHRNPICDVFPSINLRGVEKLCVVMDTVRFGSVRFMTGLGIWPSGRFQSGLPSVRFGTGLGPVPNRFKNGSKLSAFSFEKYHSLFVNKCSDY